jgi:hypothetical protein
MADDINSYALNLAFNVQTKPAIAGFGDVLDAITNIRNGIEKVGQILSDKVTKTLTTIQDQFEQISISTEKISDTTTQLNTDFTKASKTISLTSKNYHTITTELEKQLKQQKLLNQVVKSRNIDSDALIDSITQQVDTGEEINAVWHDIGKSSNAVSAQGGKHVTTGNQVAAAWTNVNNAIGGAAGQSSLLGAAGNQVAAAWTSTKKAIVDTVAGFASMLIGIEAFKVGFTGFVDSQNRFNTLNYRIYGTQSDILRQVGKTTTANKLMFKESMIGYTELAAIVRTNKDDLSKMVATNAMYSNMLGVNQKDLAAWQRAMMGVGLTSKEADSLLLRQSESMKRLGLSAQQVAGILGDQANKAARLNMLWGKEGTSAINEMQTNMAGLGNALNLPANQVSDMQKSLNEIFTDPYASSYFVGMGKVSEEAAARIAKLDITQQKAATDMARATDGLNKQVNQLAETYKKTGGRGVAYTVMLDAFKEATHMSGEAADGFIRAQMRINETLKAGDKPINVFTASSGDLVKALKLVKDAEDAAAEQLTGDAKRNYLYGSSINSLSKTFEVLWGKMQAAWQDIFIAIEPTMRWFLDSVLTPIIENVAWFMSVLSGTVPPAKAAAGAIDELNKAAKPAVTGLGWLGNILSTIWSHCGPLEKGLTLVAAGIGAIFLAFAGAAAVIGLWYVFMRVTNAPKLFAIAAAALSVGAGILAIAYAIKMLADLDYGKLWSAVGALAVVFGILALAVLGMSTGVGALAAVALAAVLVVIAGAAMLAAGAAYVLSLAFEKATDSLLRISEISGADLLLLGGALIIFGGELIVAAITIGIGGAAMLAASIALGLGMGGLSVAMFLLSDSAVAKMKTLSDGTLANFGYALAAVAPGIMAFTAAAGFGIMFAKGMGGLAAGLERLSAIDAAALLSVSYALSVLMQSVGRIPELRIDDIVGAFYSLIPSIPVIEYITGLIASAIQSGQEKIKSQIDELKISFAALESISSKFDVPIGSTEATDKKRVAAETISTIQVKTETSGSVLSARWQQEDMQKQQIDLMSVIAGAVTSLTKGNVEDVGVIRGLLEEHLPKLGESPSKLGTRMNNWS